MITNLPFPKPHPRLFLSREQIRVLQTHVISDSVSARLFHHIQNFADSLLELPPQRRELQGNTLLLTARNVLKRVFFLSTAALIKEDARYVRRAIAEMEAVAEFKDWHPAGGKATLDGHIDGVRIVPGARMIVLHTHTEAGQTGGFRLVAAMAASAGTEPPVPRSLATW